MWTYLTPHFATPGGHRRRWFRMNRWSERDAIRKSALNCGGCGVGVSVCVSVCGSEVCGVGMCVGVCVWE